MAGHRRHFRPRQASLGDLVYVELPNVGDSVEAGNAVAVVESVKAASDVYSPVSGKVVEVNAALDQAGTINEDAYGEGWLFVVELSEPEQINELLGPDDYAELRERRPLSTSACCRCNTKTGRHQAAGFFVPATRFFGEISGVGFLHARSFDAATSSLGFAHFDGIASREVRCGAVGDEEKPNGRTARVVIGAAMQWRQLAVVAIVSARRKSA
jgi:glycine cleavage system H protein